MVHTMLRTLKALFWLAIVLLAGVLLPGAEGVRAQGGEPVPIAVGENQIGQVTVEQPLISYSLAIEAAQSVDLQVLAVTQGFAPALRLTSASGEVLVDLPNETAQSAARVTALELDAGLYRIDVQSANGQPGQFVIGVLAGAPPLRRFRWCWARRSAGRWMARFSTAVIPSPVQRRGCCS